MTISNRQQIDVRPQAQALLARLKESLPKLSMLLESYDRRLTHEDGLYRFYHQSMKVYSLQYWTLEGVSALRSLVSDQHLNSTFEAIIQQGTGIEFCPDHNARWLEVTRPIVEAFLHTKYFLEMAVRYGTQLEKSPAHAIPSGCAALLYLYDMR
jgi:hypothetical protein